MSALEYDSLAVSPSSEEPLDTPSLQSPSTMDEDLTSGLEDLQTDEQRRVLDAIAQVRKCGLESILSLPQLVVCGDQSAGKSSVLEALTEIPFPRNDNLCTRFATEIILKRAASNSLTIKIIPDDNRPSAEQTTIKNFEESITNFDDLPRVMDMAMQVMGLAEDVTADTKLGAFTRDILSIEIEGPKRPQLTLVDIPGLIANATKGITDSDVKMVAEITDNYISSPRTICLAVISATNDYANQPIVTKVRQFDPDGDRTLGIITKPDRLPAGSGSEKAFISLAQNKDIFFKLGWHVLKNRNFEERNSSLMQRNSSEKMFFATSNFNVLDEDNVGIEALKHRLSHELFEHIKNELPKLRRDLETALSESQRQLQVLGQARSSLPDCKAYLARLSLDYHSIAKAAVNGHYEDEYFLKNVDPTFSMVSASTLSRTRAVVQLLNTNFAKDMEKSGHVYHFDMSDSSPAISVSKPRGGVTNMSKEKSLEWVQQAIARNKGKELVGNFNPLVIGELFWEQSEKWRGIAADHIMKVDGVCTAFLKNLLQDKAPKDVMSRVWSSIIEEKLTIRKKAAIHELDLLTKDLRGRHPINYNHYYTDTIAKNRQDRQTAAITKSVEAATSEYPALGFENYGAKSTKVDIEKVVANFNQSTDPNMEKFGCEEALDCLQAIYKASIPLWIRPSASSEEFFQEILHTAFHILVPCSSSITSFLASHVLLKNFIANVTTQVIERHIVSDLENIFSPVVVSDLPETSITAVASEPATTKKLREHLKDQIKKLESGQDIFRSVMGGVAA